jgi:hypothetical protein
MALQAGKIKSLFPNSKVSFDHNKLIWVHTICPSALSECYDIKLIYCRGQHPSIYVIKPKLKLFIGATKLPHVYDNERQHLCLYYKPTKEWNSDMLLVETVIPWTCEWLLHYEIWVGTGTWHGGGIHNDDSL